MRHNMGVVVIAEARQVACVGGHSRLRTRAGSGPPEDIRRNVPWALLERHVSLAGPGRNANGRPGCLGGAGPPPAGLLQRPFGAPRGTRLTLSRRSLAVRGRRPESVLVREARGSAGGIG